MVPCSQYFICITYTSVIILKIQLFPVFVWWGHTWQYSEVTSGSASSGSLMPFSILLFFSLSLHSSLLLPSISFLSPSFPLISTAFSFAFLSFPEFLFFKNYRYIFILDSLIMLRIHCILCSTLSNLLF